MKPKLVVSTAQAHLKLGSGQRGGIEAGYEKGWCWLPFLDPHLSPLSVSSNTPAIVADISKPALVWLRSHWGWKWLYRPQLFTAGGDWTEAGSALWGLQSQPMTSCFFTWEGFESGVKDRVKHLEYRICVYILSRYRYSILNKYKINILNFYKVLW